MIRFYKVGGCVRDKLLQRPCHDVDYSVEAPSFAAMRDAINEKGGHIFNEKEEYLTIRSKYDNQVCDFVMCRKDGIYRDQRRPDEVIPGSLADDLARRDFTMNAMAEDEEGNLIDLCGGLEDLHNRLIRCNGSIDRLKEDALRIIRAIRFYIVLPGFRLDGEIVRALNDITYVSGLSNVSDERIREELEKCFQHNTLLTLKTLNDYPLVMDQLFVDKKIWLKPTFTSKVGKTRHN